MLLYYDKISEVMSRLEEALECVVPGEFVALLNLDIDNFKMLNDSVGHTAADELVGNVETALNIELSDRDYIGRSGNDEFIILCDGLRSREECEAKALQIMNVFDRHRFDAGEGRRIYVSASMGVVIVPKDGKGNFKEILRNLESSLHVAKEAGKGTYRIFDSSLENVTEDKYKLQDDMQRGLRENQFELYYQPKVNLHSDCVYGFEALLRWHHPTKGILLPSEFIPFAEESDIIFEIGRLVLRNGCRQLGIWQKSGRDVSLALNLSGKQFREPGIINFILSCIAENDINPNKLEIEITETAAISDFDYTIMVINMLRQIGVTFSLDDFGTGYSSLSYLKQLPVDSLKIDKSFMDTMPDDDRDQMIVETIISLAKTLNMSVIAEGVENKKQEKLLKNMNCNYAQGFLYSCAVPANIASLMIG